MRMEKNTCFLSNALDFIKKKVLINYSRQFIFCICLTLVNNECPKSILIDAWKHHQSVNIFTIIFSYRVFSRNNRPNTSPMPTEYDLCRQNMKLESFRNSICLLSPTTFHLVHGRQIRRQLQAKNVSFHYKSQLSDSYCFVQNFKMDKRNIQEIQKFKAKYVHKDIFIFDHKYSMFNYP